MSCMQTIFDYGLRSVGIGERLLPRDSFTLCEQFTLIGSGIIWNVYFGVFALATGFFLAMALAVAKSSENRWSQTRCMVHLHLPWFTALHSVLLRLFSVSEPEKCQPDL